MGLGYTDIFATRPYVVAEDCDFTFMCDRAPSEFVDHQSFRFIVKVGLGFWVWGWGLGSRVHTA